MEIVWNNAALNAALRGPGGPVAAYLGRVGLRVESQAKLNLGESSTVDTGHLRQKITHVVAKSGDDLAVYVGTNLYYGLIMELGRKPGSKMPPIDAILEWVDRKGIDKDPATQRSTAFLIARSIAVKGIEGRHYLRDALPAARGVI